MEILQIVSLGVIATILIMLIKKERPEIAVLISIVVGIAIFILSVSKLSAILELLNTFTEKVSIDTRYISTLFKIIGIAYIAEFGAEVCKDAGEASIAAKIELAGKLIIAALAFPIIASLLDLIAKILP
ncbi:MAG TPA: stage III sporulation protein AD [Clostridiaceae bacterium]|nr:stage III sporulation protein AD [Clostridiaceae bacterium]